MITIQIKEMSGKMHIRYLWMEYMKIVFLLMNKKKYLKSCIKTKGLSKEVKWHKFWREEPKVMMCWHLYMIWRKAVLELQKKQEYITAFGYGIKEKDFSNEYGDIRVLVAHFKNDGSYYTSTIKSNGGGSAKHYVRFLTEEDAQRYIDEKLGDGYTPFQAKLPRVLKLLDSVINV